MITQQLVEACKLSSKPVWRQAKDMLKEEGMEVADADSTTDLKDPAAAQVKVPSRPLAIHCLIPCSLLLIASCNSVTLHRNHCATCEWYRPRIC